MDVDTKPETQNKDRWEFLFVYGFLTRFTTVKKKVALLNTPMDLEDAVLFNGYTPVMHAILEAFIQNLWWTKNMKDCDCRPDHIEQTLTAVLDRYCKNKEQTVWWSNSRQANINPLAGGRVFFSIDWEAKLKILRQLVEWQLIHSKDVKETIDKAWGVHHKITSKVKLAEMEKKEKAAQTKAAAKGQAELPPPADGPSREEIELNPLGMDCEKKRYWAADDSPRIWKSGNPWKHKCAFTIVSTSREEYVALIGRLKASQPETEGKKIPRAAQNHQSLVANMEARLPAIDEELQRIEKAMRSIQRKAEKEARMAELAEMRETRTRSRRRVDYAALEQGNAPEAGEEDDGDSDEDSLSTYEDADQESLAASSTRRSSRTSRTASRASSSADVALRGARKRKSDEIPGERRSSRLAVNRFQFDEDEEEDGAERNVRVRVKRRRIDSPDPETGDAIMTVEGKAPSTGHSQPPTGSFLRPRNSKGALSTDGERTSEDTPSLISDGSKRAGPERSSSLSSLSSAPSDDDF